MIKNLIPTPKVATSGITGIVVSFIIYELNTRFNIQLTAEEGGFLTTVAGVVAAYFAPHSKPTAEQEAKIITDNQIKP